MNRDIQDVESILADVGRRCNPRLIERKHVHVRQIKIGDAEKGTNYSGGNQESVADTVNIGAEKHALGAQLSLLHRCTTSISRLLRRRSSLLLVAKILVVSRSLHKSLSKHESSPPFLDDLWKQVASLRQTLLKRINKRLASTSATEDTIIESLAAYCLATSSSSDDAIHHFHQVRLDVIVGQLDMSRENIPRALQLFVQTLQASKVLRSHRFSDVLLKLKARPLLTDPEIQNLDGLEVEVLGRWVAPDVKNFTPWIKLSELNRAQGVESIKEWSLQAFKKFSEGCQKSLAQSTDFSELLSLRTETVELWLSSWGSTIIHGSVDVLEILRNIFNEQLSRILNVHAQSLGEVGTQVSSIISNWENTDHSSVGSLWDADLITAEFTNGAQAFKQTVADRLLGRDEDVSTVLIKYQAWLASIQQFNESIDSLRRTRWTDILVGGEVEDEDIDITPRLNEDDPRHLSDSLESAVRDAFSNLQTSFKSAFDFTPSHSSEKATFLLRLIRLVRRDIPTGFVSADFVFSSEIVPDLQKLLATEVVAKAGSLSLIPSPKSHPQTSNIKIVPGRSLWEGEPAIPVQPSASSFKLLRRLTSLMDTCGLDLWDPSTVQALKQELKTKLEAAISAALDDLDSVDVPSNTETEEDQPTANGGEEKEDKTEENPETQSLGPDQVEGLRDWKVQLFFDSLYLSQMLGERNQLAGVVERTQKSAGSTADTVKTIKKLATGYWTRTELLFGLLAGH